MQIKLIVYTRERMLCRYNLTNCNKIYQRYQNSQEWHREKYTSVSRRLSHGNFMKYGKLPNRTLQSRFIFHWIHVACIPKIRPLVKRTVKAIASRLYVSRKSVSPNADYLDYQGRKFSRDDPYFLLFLSCKGGLLRARFATKRLHFRH